MPLSRGHILSMAYPLINRFFAGVSKYAEHIGSRSLDKAAFDQEILFSNLAKEVHQRQHHDPRQDAMCLDIPQCWLEDKWYGDATQMLIADSNAAAGDNSSKGGCFAPSV